MANKGIPKIFIPIRAEELTIDKVETYLPTVFNQFTENARKIHNYYENYCLNHAILSKVRPHDDTSVNNIVVIPNLKSVIDWKVGYILGNPIKYSQSKFRDTDDITLLNKYVRSACKRSVDKDVATWAYATGVGYYFIEPMSEIDSETDSEDVAPFEIYCRASDTCTKVYSAYGSHKPLFDVLYTNYTKIEKDGLKVKYDVLDIYLPDAMYTYEKNITTDWKLVDVSPRGLYKKLPLVEKRPDIDGIGIVAMGEDLQNAADKLISNGLDNVEDIVNEIYVYYNVDLGETPEEQRENHIAMKGAGAVVLTSTSPDIQPKLETISPKLTLDEIRNIYALVNSVFHAVVGVPMEMSGTNSGGTTKQGSEVANGYDNAYNRALNDINSFLRADTELLSKILWICRETPNSGIDNISTSDIDIMYSINLTDNIQTKAQAYGTLIQTMPPDMVLRICRLSNDAETDGKAIDERMKELASRNKTVNENIDVIEENS